MNILYILLVTAAAVLFFADFCNCAKSVVKSQRPITNNQNKITRIIGGEVASVPIPYQVSLQLFNRLFNRWRHICGGSIIGPKHILTAAHCTDGRRAEDLSVVVGTSSLRIGGFRHYVRSYVQHELYSAKGAPHNDVAVMKVSVPFKFSEKIAPISLAENFDQSMEKNYPVTLTGWGVTDMYSQILLPDNLMILNYTTFPNEECKLKGYKELLPSELCAFYGRSRGSCLGDSGGPLVNRERNIQIGLVSYGSNLCATNRPDVYVRVSKFIPWILKAVTELIP